MLDEQSSVLQNRPTVDVLPASDDPSDISVSTAALAYLNWLADESVADFNEQLAIAALWALAGISVEQFDEMVRRQSSACAVCREIPKTTLCVDHTCCG